MNGSLRAALAVLCGALAGLLAAAPGQAAERILLFVSDVRVERDASLSVTETIRVQAEGREIRRGILRDFPTDYRRRDGTRVQVGFEVLSVTRGGAAEPFATERLANGVRVRIGSADRLIGRGVHDYVIRYRTTRQIGFFPDFDELYWNATGTGWTFPIDVAEARIALPEPIAFRQSAVYTGPQGSTARNARVVRQEPGTIVFRTTAPLAAREGLTVAAAWPKGVVVPPSQTQEAAWWLRDNLPHAVAGLGLLFAFAYYGFAWLKVGRDPRAGTIIPLFGPPEGMSAAAVRYVREMGFDNRVFSAAVLDLAVQGHLKLKDSGGTMDVERGAGGKPIAPAEAETKEKLFAGGDRLRLQQANHARLGAARAALKDGLKAAYAGKLFRTNAGWAGFGFLLCVLVIAAIVAAVLTTYGGDRGGGMVFGMLFPVIPAMIGASMLQGLFPLTWRGIVAVLFVTGFIGAFVVAGLVVLFASAGSLIAGLPGVAPLALVALAGVAIPWLAAPTREGRKAMDEIEGFRRYLDIAEEDRLEFLNPPEKTPELFERFLPYAVALDVENSWAKKFAGILATAAAGAAVASWYSGQHDWARDPAGFADHLGSDLSQTIASASSAPGSSGGSGSGGGGSSGGGGGGGGGSGW